MKKELPRRMATLRRIIGLSQAELAELCDKSIHTIQSIEGGRLPVSRDLANRLTNETGVNFAWLIGVHSSDVPVDRLGAVYTKETFEEVRALRMFEKNRPITTDQVQREGSLADDLLMIRNIHHSALIKGQGPSFRYRLREFLKTAIKEFGTAKDENDVALWNDAMEKKIDQDRLLLARLETKLDRLTHDGVVKDPRRIENKIRELRALYAGKKNIESYQLAVSSIHDLLEMIRHEEGQVTR